MIERSKGRADSFKKCLWPATLALALLGLAMAGLWPLKIQRPVLAQTTTPNNLIFFGNSTDSTLHQLQMGGCGVTNFNPNLPAGSTILGNLAVEPFLGQSSQGRIIAVVANSNGPDTIVVIAPAGTSSATLVTTANAQSPIFDSSPFPNLFFTEDASGGGRQIQFLANNNGTFAATPVTLFSDATPGAIAFSPTALAVKPSTGDLYFIASDPVTGQDTLFVLTRTSPLNAAPTFAPAPIVAFAPGVTFASTGVHNSLVFDSNGNLFAGSTSFGNPDISGDTGTIEEFVPVPGTPLYTASPQGSIFATNLGDISQIAISLNNIILVSDFGTLDVNGNPIGGGRIVSLNTNGQALAAPCVFSTFNPGGVAVVGNINTINPFPNNPLTTNCANAAATSTVLTNFLNSLKTTNSAGQTLTPTTILAFTGGPGANPVDITLPASRTNVTFPLGATGVEVFFTDPTSGATLASGTSVTITSDLAVTPPNPATVTIGCTVAGGATGASSTAINAFLTPFSTTNPNGPKATSSCGPPTLVSTTAPLGAAGATIPVTSTTVFPLGTTTVTFTFRDTSGQTATTTGKVTVNVAPPVITTANLTPTATCVGGAAVLNQLRVTATSVCGTTPTLSFALPNGTPVTAATVFPLGLNTIIATSTSSGLTTTSTITFNVLLTATDPRNGNTINVDVANKKFTFILGGGTVLANNQPVGVLLTTSTATLRNTAGQFVVTGLFNCSASRVQVNVFDQVQKKSFTINTVSTLIAAPPPAVVTTTRTAAPTVVVRGKTTPTGGR